MLGIVRNREEEKDNKKKHSDLIRVILPILLPTLSKTVTYSD